MDALLLYRRGEPVREYVLEATPLEVGRGASCDIVVHDPSVPERAILVARDGAAVVTYDLAQGGKLGPGRILPPGGAVALGREHVLSRIVEGRSRRLVGETQPLASSAKEGQCQLGILVGAGSDARRVSVGTRPLTVGSSPDNDVVLADRTVSAHHCRLEPGDGHLTIRDLGSRNGTWLDGVQVLTAKAYEGSRLRVGRTDLRLVPRGSRGDARASGMIAASPAMLHVLGEVESHARLSWPVLIQGESGAGKEGIARALHLRGPRARGPFVALNAGGLPRELVESELFGHERGAFTGAVSARKGAFEQAEAGTLFLDEVGELPLDLQARLLRVLECWEIRRVGSEAPLRVDVRLVCATHRDLRAMVSEGSFREDLYYRIARLVLSVPPLRKRPEDILALADHFLSSIADEVGRRRLTDEARSRLLAHGWPGNARELRNVLSAAAASTPAEAIEAADVERAIRRIAGPVDARRGRLSNLEEVLERHKGNTSAAARALGIPRSTLRDRIRELREAGAQRITKLA